MNDWEKRQAAAHVSLHGTLTECIVTVRYISHLLSICGDQWQTFICVICFSFVHLFTWQYEWMMLQFTRRRHTNACNDQCITEPIRSMNGIKRGKMLVKTTNVSSYLQSIWMLENYMSFSISTNQTKSKCICTCVRKVSILYLCDGRLLAKRSNKRIIADISLSVISHSSAPTAVNFQ